MHMLQGARTGITNYNYNSMQGARTGITNYNYIYNPMQGARTGIPGQGVYFWNEERLGQNVNYKPTTVRLYEVVSLHTCVLP